MPPLKLKLLHSTATLMLTGVHLVALETGSQDFRHPPV